MLTGEIPLPLPVDPGHVDGALALDVADHLRHRIFRRYRDHHVHVVRHQVAFLDPALLLRRQTAQDLAEMRSKLAEQGFAATFRDEHDMVFALPPGMAWALELVHRGSTFRVLGGSRKRASRWTPEYVKLLLSPRHSRGITLVYLFLRLFIKGRQFRQAGNARPDPPTSCPKDFGTHPSYVPPQ